MELALPEECSLVLRLDVSEVDGFWGVALFELFEGGEEGIALAVGFVFLLGFLLGGPLRVSEETEFVLVVLRAGDGSFRFLFRRLS